jgi:hypothetical protein
MMKVQIFPDFTKPEQQRYRGLLTPQQVIALMTVILPLSLGVLVNGVVCVPLVLVIYGLLVFWAMVPYEGGTRGVHLLCQLEVALDRREIEDYEAFQHADITEMNMLPVHIETDDGEVLLSAEIPLEEHLPA